jgi:Fic family protein
MKIDPTMPYNELPDLPPTGDMETKNVLKSVISARESLQILQNSCKSIPNPDVLMNTLPVLEAGDSSKIENVITTADELFKYDPNKPPEDATGTKEAYNYCIALRRGWELLCSGKPICTNTAIEIAQILQESIVRIRNHGVSLANHDTGMVYYTPPTNEDIILKKLRNWEQFINSYERIDPLVRLAISHYQFEAIHPFIDGNGRTGRILNILLLVQYNFLDSPILYMSKYILENRTKYYQLLRDVTFDNQWEEWILFILDAIECTAKWTERKVCLIRVLIEKVGNKIWKKFPKIYSLELMDVIFSQPYCRIKTLVDHGIAGRQTAAKYIEALVKCGILSAQSTPGPEKLYLNSEFMEILCSEN